MGVLLTSKNIHNYQTNCQSRHVFDIEVQHTSASCFSCKHENLLRQSMLIKHDYTVKTDH